MKQKRTSFRLLAAVTALSAVFGTSSVAALERLESDVVVVGGGAAGSAAAIAAQEQGAKTVLLEKTAFPAGAGTFAGGLFAADSSQQKEQGKVVDKAWLYKQYMDISGGYVNSRLVRRIIDESGFTVDWLNKHGADVKLVSAGTGHAFDHVGMPATLHAYQKGGAKAIRALHDSFRKLGGTIRYTTPAQELLFDEEGRICGVKAKDKKGETVEIRAKAVVLATGGFGGNAEMMTKFIGKPHTLGEVTQNTGDGLRMAWKAGAAERGAEVAQYFFQKLSSDSLSEVSAALGKPYPEELVQMSFRPFLRVNLAGDRFSDETKVTLFAIHGAELHMQPQETEYMLFDETALEKIAEGGYAAIEEHFGAFRDKPEFFMEFNLPNDTKVESDEERKPRDLRAMFAKLAESTPKTKTVVKGESIADLARALGMDPKRLEASVAQYNEAAETGRDDLFFADGKRFEPLLKGPFYAVKWTARNLGTLGGIAVDEKLRAITDRGDVVPGLWAAGADAGGMYGKSYVDFEGGTLGFAYISGRLAGEDAAKYVQR